MRLVQRTSPAARSGRTPARLLHSVALLAVSSVVCLSGVVLTDAAAASRLPRVNLARGATYVALGSSYAAGTGIANQLGSCTRSDHNYPHLVAAALGLNLVDVSCGAATVPNLLDTPQGPNPPQVDAVTADTSLITITVGGNDLGYSETALACGQRGNPGCALDAGQLQLELSTLRTNLLTLISKLKAKAPSATIVFVPYPRMVPASGNCPELSFTNRGARILATIGRQLEAVSVAVARQSDIRLADPYVLAAGHGPCVALGQRWIAGHTAVNGFPYHPTAAGHVEMAKLVEAALRE